MTTAVAAVLAAATTLALAQPAGSTAPAADYQLGFRAAVPARDFVNPQPSFGTQFHGMWSNYTDADRAAVLDRLAAGGARWVRLDVAWDMIQPDRSGQYNQWGVSFVDRVVDMAHQRGLKVLVMFWLTPRWAGPVQRGAPTNPADYGRAIGWAASRWADKVDAWEVWNEPNLEGFWVGTDPASYTRLLCAAYPQVKAADPTARVVFAGVVHNDNHWIADAYDAGAKGCFDVMATHPYPGPADAAPSDPDTGDIWDFRHVTAVRELMRARGDAKPIWFTELGWSTHPNSGAEKPWNRGVTEAQQAAYAVDALRLVRDEYPYVKRVFWYNERNKVTGDVHQDNFGILRRDVTPKPAWYGIREFLLGPAAG